MVIKKPVLEYLYIEKKLSVAAIAKKFDCSQNKINYWLKEYDVAKRSISEALYLKHNPKGNPFKVKKPENDKDFLWLGIGLGLYWGQGSLANKSSIRISSTDPSLITIFIRFLTGSFYVDAKKLRFGLQINTDKEVEGTLNFWIQTLKEFKIGPEQFQKPSISVKESSVNKINKRNYGVLTLYYNNKKLRNIICKTIENM